MSTKTKKINKNKIEKRKLQTKAFFKKVWEILKRPEMFVLPGQLAFFLILSLVPIVTLIGYAASFINIQASPLGGIIEHYFGEDVMGVIIPFISQEPFDLKIILIFIILFYVASNGPASLIYTANEIHGIPQSTWLKRRIKAIVMTILLIILYLFILVVPVLGSKILSIIDYFHIKTILEGILHIFNGPIAWLIIFLFIKVIFTLAPDKKMPGVRMNLGAIFTTVGWVIATSIYGYYSTNIARYDLFYAGLSNIAILMLWAYLLCYILVIGLSLTTKVTYEELEKTGSIENPLETKI